MYQIMVLLVHYSKVLKEHFSINSMVKYINLEEYRYMIHHVPNNGFISILKFSISTLMFIRW